MITKNLMDKYSPIYEVSSGTTVMPHKEVDGDIKGIAVVHVDYSDALYKLFFTTTAYNINKS
ncbi:hypothetical protein HBA_0124 [Sodalis endosymbiont of Henestaris halophilus]|nr:hypothetical protein HBA_0124 [Sodalis endosymbiont of Henestaris halophilus]